MKPRTTVILFGVFLILLVFVYLFEGPLSEKERSKKERVVELFPDFQRDSAVSIFVKGPLQEVTLEKKDAGWEIANTDGFLADPQLVDAALQTVAGFKRDTIASKNPEKKEIFDVVPGKGVEILISAVDQKPLAHFFIGKPTPDSFSSYLRKEGSDEVLQTNVSKTVFLKDVESWRDKTVISFPVDLATQLTLKTSEEEITLELDEKGTWNITQPVKTPAQQEVVKQILTTLSSLKALGFADDYDIAQYQLDDPQLTVTIILKDQVEKRLLIGKKNEENSQYYAKNQAKKTIYLIGKYHFDTANKSLKDLKAEEKNEVGKTAESADETSEVTEP